MNVSATPHRAIGFEKPKATPTLRTRQPAMPSMPPELEWAESTRCGVYHAVNQDDWRVEGLRFFGVADGVGGGAFGEVASRALLDHCADLAGLDLRNPKALVDHVMATETVVSQAVAAHGEEAGAATFVGLWLDGWHGHIIHVGDTRASRIRFRSGGASLETLTVDQTYGELGESPPEGGADDDPARMVGVDAIGDPPATPVQLRGGDILILSSDGLHRYVTSGAVEAVAWMWRKNREPLRALALRLENLAIGNGSTDDITILLLRRNPRGILRRWLWAGCLVALVGLALLSGVIGHKPDPPLPQKEHLCGMVAWIDAWQGKCFPPEPCPPLSADESSATTSFSTNLPCLDDWPLGTSPASLCRDVLAWHCLPQKP